MPYLYLLRQISHSKRNSNKNSTDRIRRQTITLYKYLIGRLKKNFRTQIKHPMFTQKIDRFPVLERKLNRAGTRDL